MGAWGQTCEVAFDAEANKAHDPHTPIYTTGRGSMFNGDSLDLLKGPGLTPHKGSVQLVFTSPPFPLNTKKRYGNLQGQEYIDWFASFAPLLRDYLTEDGSIVIEIGHAWEPGRPVVSMTVMKALLAFMEEGKLNLCQEFVWYNPARLPSPVVWVNQHRIRVKDAFTKVWWLSPVDKPKADNRKVLKPYSDSMNKLIASGKYNHGKRPSQHDIGKTSFAKDNSGAIPPNVGGADDLPSLTSILKTTNTRSVEQYQMFCRERDLPLHPARMPKDLVEFFIKFLTDEQDVVLDPFGGSNTTGATAEALNRKWLSIEAQWDYVAQSLGRFDPDLITDTTGGVEIVEE